MQNMAKAISAIETTPSNLTQIRNINGRTSHRQQRSKSESSRGSNSKFDSFQDPLSAPLYESGQKGHKMSSFQDPLSGSQYESGQKGRIKFLSRPSLKTPADSNIGTYTYEISSFQDPLSRPSTKSGKRDQNWLFSRPWCLMSLERLAPFKTLESEVNNPKHRLLSIHIN